jgi:manganese-dependent inorganic pyrophosphatase
VKTFVIGHKNPDTDAICSAIGYADFLRQIGRADVVAARCGEVPARAAFVLAAAGLPQPVLVTDVRATVGQVARQELAAVGMGDSLLDAFERMNQGTYRSLPVLDDAGRLVGMLNQRELLQRLIPTRAGDGATRVVHSSLDRIRETLGGTFQCATDEGSEQAFQMLVGAFGEVAFHRRIREFNPIHALVVVGDRPAVQMLAIQAGVRGLILTGGHALGEDLVEMAKECGITVLVSPHDTASTTLLVKCAKRVTHALDRECLAFRSTEVLDDIRGRIHQSAQTLFPVLDSDDLVIGVFSKSDLLDFHPIKLILVDHNEFSQAVTGAEEASIEEVIDHHRLGGGLQSREPIRFINEPLGSTCTIVARSFHQAGATPSPEIALILAAGLISDTLNLSSPTTTAVDRQMLDWLGALAGRDLALFARDFFSAGSPLQDRKASEAVAMDCKEFSDAGRRFAIAQIEECGLERFHERKPELRAALAELRAARHLDFAALLVTDLDTHDSVLLIEAPDAIGCLIDYAQLEEGLYDLPGIVSRKKQLLPHFLALLRRAG